MLGGIVQIEKLDSIPGRECRRHHEGHEGYFGKMVDSFQRNQVGNWRDVMGARRRRRRRR